MADLQISRKMRDELIGSEDGHGADQFLAKESPEGRGKAAVLMLWWNVRVIWW
jgi:hypothetical protein